MTILTRHSNDSGYIISAYKQGALHLGEEVYTSPILVRAGELAENWTTKALTELTTEDFALALEWQPEILLFGSGPSLQFPDFSIIRDLREHKLSLEVMDTSAASRTFNVLRSEGRNVVAALLV
ncbi:MAG: hypothetical protein HKN88_00495 [Gammaproteobacteria bacterium]|nr:hypothetical protein [Gammaproteobacteria bacterium]NNC96529.1 hypothetical protein [Gammaproteobacteria bacterium]NNM13033.1 hypothetical protein [Gammaproteobacteria bacterium]